MLLFAALAAAQSDIFISYWFNATATKHCADDAPSRCFLIPKIDINIDPTKTLVVVTYACAAVTGVCSVANPIGDYSLLRHIVTTSRPWHIINVPRSGLLYSTGSFRIGPPGSGDREKVSSAPYTACGRTYPHAYYASAGSYNITPLPTPLFLVDLERCVEYRIAAHAGAVVNITRGWFSLYLAELAPPARRIYTSGASIVLNGTQHAYFTQFQWSLTPSGAGFYITGTAVPTLVIDYQVPSVWYGPRHYSALRNGTILSVFSPMYGFYGIGEAPSDGVFVVRFVTAVSGGPFEVAYVANSTAGYFRLYPRTLLGGVVVYAKRFDVVDLSLRDASGLLYNTRGVACPAYTSIASVITAWSLSRLDRVGWIEVCNNRTETVYVALLHRSDWSAVEFFYADRIEPRKCARLIWDSAISSRPTLYVYATARDVCSRRHIFVTTNYNPGWRHFLFQNNTLRPVAPIAPDYDYASLWQQLLNLLSQQYSDVWSSFASWYASQPNTTAATYTNLTNFLRTQPRFIGTIKMDTATSVWLRTTLNELQKWQTTSSSASFDSVSLPQVPAAIAPVAAAAVAVAWAASRRDDDVATTAAVAGIALALFGILMTLIYGTESLALVALGVIVAAAAAAWRRIS